MAKYADKRLHYLESYQPELLEEYKADGSLEEHLQNVQRSCTEIVESMVKRMIERDTAAGKMPDKNTDYAKYVGTINMMIAQAEEVCDRDYIYPEEYEEPELSDGWEYVDCSPSDFEGVIPGERRVF